MKLHFIKSHCRRLRQTLYCRIPRRYGVRKEGVTSLSGFSFDSKFWDDFVSVVEAIKPYIRDNLEAISLYIVYLRCYTWKFLSIIYESSIPRLREESVLYIL